MVVHPYYGALFNSKKKQENYCCVKQSEWAPGNYTELKKATLKVTQCKIPFI